MFSGVINTNVKYDEIIRKHLRGQEVSLNKIGKFRHNRYNRHSRQLNGQEIYSKFCSTLLEVLRGRV